MKKWFLIIFPVLFVLSVFVLPSQVSAQAVDCTLEANKTPTGQTPGQCGCQTGLIVGAASKCMSPAQLQQAQGISGWVSASRLPEFKKGTEDATQNSDKLSGQILSANMAGFIDAFIGGRDKNGQAVTDSAVGNVSHMIGMLYTPSATANDYVADVLKDAGIATPAYAQGLGFSALAPVLETWKVFRTVAYFFYVVIFLVIGFMIMFRQKIGSQAVVTVQQALPKLLISLVAVTFSYAIAGLMIEIMYLAMFFIINVFAASTLNATSTGGVSFNDFGTNSNIFSVAGIIMSGNFTNSVSDAVGSIVTKSLGIQSTATGDVLNFITGLAAVLVFAIALLFSIFKLFFTLLKTYISIIIMIVTAPLALMLGALPGNNAFASWLKGLLFNLAVFPTVLLTLVMAFLLQTSISQNGGFLPPYIGGVGSAGSIGPLLGLGVLLVIPDIVEKVKKMAPAGPFDEFANKAGAALKTGYKGGELIPGFAASDTRKWAGGGLSGENVLRKGTIGVGAGVGFGVGAAEGERQRRQGNLATNWWLGAQSRAGSTARDIGGKLGDKEFKPSTPAKKP